MGAAPGSALAVFVTRVVVMGASAGGFEAIRAVLQVLPGDFPAPVFVVIHTGARAGSMLPSLLSSAGQLPASVALDGEPIQNNRIYLAPPDLHLMIEEGRARTIFGPRHHGFRPAVDPLFLSAARAWGPAAAGVILSGALDDGTVGLGAVKRAGGMALVQSPEEAVVDSMPLSAIKAVEVDAILRASDIGARLVRWANGLEHMKSRRPRKREEAVLSLSKLLQWQGSMAPPNGELLPITCPQCGGALWQFHEQGVETYGCHVGHRFGPEALAVGGLEQAETALWAAVRILREQSMMRERMALRAEKRGMLDVAAHWLEDARRVDAQALRIVSIIEGGARPAEAEPATARALAFEHSASGGTRKKAGSKTGSGKVLPDGGRARKGARTARPSGRLAGPDSRSRAHLHDRPGGAAARFDKKG
jgi:two-component system, chemotaxis family, protein-glutamate methylesterase/glutaminase